MFTRIEGRQEPYTSCKELPLIANDPVILFAILVQNAMHPKNSNRVDAIAKEEYVVIRTRADADNFLGGLLKKHLQNEMSSIEGEVQAQFQSLASEEDVKLFLEAPDIYYAAAVLTQQPFYIGKGDRNTFFKVVLNSNPKKIKDLGKKLRMLTQQKIFGKFDVYNDKLTSPERLNRQTIFRLWLHCCRRHQAVTLDEMVKAYPYQKENLEVWDKYVDEDGKTTLNPEEYKQYRIDMAEKAKQKQKEAQGKKGRKGKL